jgi:hypothetical protein
MTTATAAVLGAAVPTVATPHLGERGKPFFFCGRPVRGPLPTAEVTWESVCPGCRRAVERMRADGREFRGLPS